MNEHAIREGWKIKFIQNEPTRVRTACTFAKCPWKIFASKFDKKTSTFQVKTTYLTHECGRIDRSPFMDYKWIASNYTESFKFNRRFSATDVMTTIKQNHMLETSRSQVYRAKKNRLSN